MKEVVCLNTTRTGYSPDQIGNTMTVGELIGALQDFDEDTPVYFRNDNGYTYGRLNWETVESMEVEDNDDYDEDE